MDSSIINVMVKIARKYMKFQSVEGIGKQTHVLRFPFFYQLLSIYYSLL
jgi:hypothetical protein